VLTLVLLAVAGFLAGAMNAIAGGGSFVSLPALLWAGVDPVSANATSTLALWPGSIASAVGYRTALPKDRVLLAGLIVISLMGGVGGGTLLVKTPSGLFLKLLPFLMLVAAGVFSLGPRLRGVHSSTSTSREGLPWLSWLLHIPTALYGGYFGGGMGFMMLAAFALTLPAYDVHSHNGLKSFLAVMINAAAMVLFILTGNIAWEAGVAAMLGAIAGGYLGAHSAQRVSAAKARTAISALGWALTVVFFVRAYGKG
jgi:uncharacterized membrane protein YfcA